MSVKVTKDNTLKFYRELAKLTERRVLVGVPSRTAGRRPEEHEDGDISNAALAYIHEHGSPAQNIPARPFLKPGVVDAEDQIIERYRAGAKAVLDGKAANLNPTHTAVGLIAQRSVKAKVNSGSFAPLAPSTIAARKRRGRTGTKPLIDTAQMRNSITFVVRPKGK